MEFLTSIVRVIANDSEFHETIGDRKWIEFSIVFEVDEDGDIISLSGYAFLQEPEYAPFVIDIDDVEGEVKGYRDWLAKDTGEGFKKMLLQFNRDSGRVQADFEYDDPMRWKVTPNNIDQMIEDLRPNLGG